jgi:hypothetical protein
MKKIRLLNYVASGAIVCGSLSIAPMAFAATTSTTNNNSKTFQAKLAALNNSGTSGTATVEVNGDKATVKINTTGASANLPHMQGIYIGGKDACPTMSAASKVDGVNVLTTEQGQAAYGKLKVSLTTSGDVSPSSTIDMKHFPSADKSGSVSYSRTFSLPKGVTASDISKGVIVQQGVASIFGSKDKYDGSAKSNLDKSLPLEETVPAACGVLTAVGSGSGKGAGPAMAPPTGAPATGSGSTSGVQDTSLFLIGGAAILAAGIIGLGLNAKPAKVKVDADENKTKPPHR